MASESPVAAADQRFNLAGFAGVSQGGEGQEGADDFDAPDAEFTSAELPSAPAAQPHVSSAAAVGPMAPTLPREPLASTGSAAATRARVRPDVQAPVRTESQFVVRSDAPSARDASAEPSRSAPAPAVARDVASTLAVSAQSPEKRGEAAAREPIPAGPTTAQQVASPPQPLAQNTAFPPSLRDALARVEAWMASDTAPPAPPTPVAAKPFGSRAPMLPAAVASSSAFSPPPPAPRLTIGHIDVEVVAPAPPASPRAYRRPAQVVVAPRASSFDAATFGKLTFGMRQR